MPEEGLDEGVEGARKAREEQHDDEDEPDVVGLPDGTHRARDGVALGVAAWSAGEGVEDATAEVGARQDAVRAEAQHDKRAHRLSRTHGWCSEDGTGVRAR